MTPILLTDTVTTDLDRALHYALLWGHEGLAIRTFGRHGERIPYVNEAKLKRRLDEHDLPLVAVEPGLFEGAAGDRVQALTDLGALPETLSFCVRFGCRLVLVGALAADSETSPVAGAEVLRRAGEAAAKQGVVLGVRNQAGTACAGGAALAALLAEVAHPNVRAAWSPVEALVAKRDQAASLKADAHAVGPHAALVVVRDGRGAGGVWTEAIPGEGTVGWENHLQILHDGGFNGPCCLEVHGEPAGPFGLRATTSLVQLQRRAID
ncbi:MAG: TIM barrel protein [Bacteroidota bacterium]